MCFDDVVGDGESESRTLGAFLGGKKRLQDFVLDVVRDTGTVILDIDSDAVFVTRCAHR